MFLQSTYRPRYFNWLLLVLLLFLSKHIYAQDWKLKGRVTDESNGKPVANATVNARQSRTSVLSDSLGYFSITLKAGEQAVSFSSVGYQAKTVTVRYQEILSGLEIRLLPEVRQLSELTVREAAPDANVRSSQMSVIKLDIRNLKNIPVVFGEIDIIKALTLQAGVTTVGEGTAGFNVRGGRTDQNLVLLDGTPLFNTSHLLGFLSNVNADVIRDVTLYKGDIPASYGGRLSSLLSISTRNGNKEKTRMAASVGLMTAGITADGPLTANKRLTYLVSGRIAYPNLMIKLLPSPSNQNRAFFYDLNGRLSYDLSANSVVTVTGYHSNDAFRFPEDTLYGWRSTAATASWSKRISPALSMELAGHLSHYRFELEGISPTNEYLFGSGIKQHDGQFRLLWTPSAVHKVEAGLSYVHYLLSPGDLSPRKESSITNIELEKERAREQAIYISEEWNPLPWLGINAGLRYVMFANVGPGTVFQYDPAVSRTVESITDTLVFAKGKPIAKFSGLEPRLSARFSLSSESSVKMSYTKTRQYLHLISNTTAISPVDFWKLADSFVPPQSAQQVALGYFRNFRDNAFETSVEVYGKTLENLVEYKNGASLLLNKTIETDLIAAQGKAYGVEVSIQKTSGIVTGLAAYTFSRTFNKVQTAFPSEQINRGAWYPATVDRPHNLSISAQWKWKNNWTFGSNFVYTTGRPITYPDGTYRLNDVIVQDYSARNLDRVPDYHRLDVSFTKDTRTKPEQQRYAIWSFSIYNVYARKNPYSVYFKQAEGRLISYRLSVFGTIIPSVNLKFYL